MRSFRCTGGVEWIPLLLAMTMLTGCATTCPKGEAGIGPMTEEQIHKLAEKILENTPENIHYAKGTTFSWVLVKSEEMYANPQPLQNNVVQLLKRKYTVYFDEESLPAGAVFRDSDGHWIGYNDGFSFRWRVNSCGQNKVKVEYFDLEGNLGAAFHWKIYRWDRQDWQIAEAGNPIVSAVPHELLDCQIMATLPA